MMCRVWGTIMSLKFSLCCLYLVWWPLFWMTPMILLVLSKNDDFRKKLWHQSKIWGTFLINISHGSFCDIFSFFAQLVTKFYSDFGFYIFVPKTAIGTQIVMNEVSTCSLSIPEYIHKPSICNIHQKPLLTSIMHWI